MGDISPPLAPAETAAAVDATPEPQPPLPSRPGRSLSLTPAVWILAVLAIVASLYLARAFFVPLLIGVLASYTLCPMVDALEKFRIPRVIAAALVLAVLAGGFSWMVFSLRDDALDMLDKLPETARKLRQSISAAHTAGPTPLQQVQKAATELQRAAAEATGASAPARSTPEPAPLAWVSDYALAQATLIVAVIAQAPLVLLLTYFLLASGEHFRRKLIILAGPSLSSKKVTLGILHEIDTQVQRYMMASLATNILTGLGTWIAFELLGVQVAGLWGVAAGVLHFIPYLGPAIIALASGVAGFLQFDSLTQGLAVAGASLVVATIAGMMFMPWLQSRISRTNAAVLFIVLLFFGWMWGAWGLLLGAPLLAIFKVICDRIEPLQPLGELIGR